MIRTQDFLGLDIGVDATFFDPIANTEMSSMNVPYTIYLWTSGFGDT